MAQISNERPPKFDVGQRVVIHSTGSGSASRDAAFESFVGEMATVRDYYYIYSPDKRQVFYVYTIKLVTGDKRELVAHEDELRPMID